MAANEAIAQLLPQGVLSTSTVFATYDTINDGSTVVGVIPVLDFDGSAQNEYADWEFFMPSNYAGTTGLSFVVHYAMAGTDGSDVQFEIRAKKLVAGDAIGSHDLGGATATDITDTPNGTANVVDVSPAGAIAKADIGTPAAGDLIRVRLARDYDHAANTDDCQVLGVYVYET